jgi:hypothetical protein
MVSAVELAGKMIFPCSYMPIHTDHSQDWPDALSARRKMHRIRLRLFAGSQSLLHDISDDAAN